MSERQRYNNNVGHVWDALVEGPDPETCIGQLAERLDVTDGLGVCPHLARMETPLPWFVFLAHPDRAVCAACVPEGYRRFQQTGEPVLMDCECCGARRWLVLLAQMTAGAGDGGECALGTALGMLCAACAVAARSGDRARVLVSL